MSEPGPENQNLFQPDGAPDWDAVTFDVLCSRCGYNLRTLTRPKCTECGLEFEWREVITAKANESDFLFEHQWRRQPIRSFVKTVWRSLRPRAFWSSVSIHQPVRPGVLWFLVLISPLVFWGLVMGTAHGLTYASSFRLDPRSSPFERYLYREIWHIARTYFNLTMRYPSWAYGWWIWVPILASVLIMWTATIAVLCGLRQTLAKCRVRPVQMLRVAAYSAMPVSICCAIALLVNLWLFGQLQYDHTLRQGLFMQLSGPLILLAITSFYLHRGLKHYLRLPRAGRVAIVAAIIGMLALFNYLGAFIMTPMGLGWFPEIMPFSS